MPAAATPVTPVVAAVLGSWPRRSPAPAAASADSANADPWFGRDKLLHFAAAGSLAVVGYANASMLTENRPARAAAGAALAVGAGVAKELWDLDGHGDASWRDLGLGSHRGGHRRALISARRRLGDSPIVPAAAGRRTR